MRQEFDDLRAADCAREQAEVEIPPGHASNGRQNLPVEMILEYRSLSSWCPGPAPIRPFGQSTFVDEDDGAPFFLGFFLISGQRCFFHCWIAVSFRSNARPVGRWQLQPNWRRIRQTCPGWYVTPHSCSIRSATRLLVHRPDSYPNASGPRFSPFSIFFRPDSVSRGIRPARPAFLKPVRPLWFSCVAHLLPDCGCTPTFRATSASDTPSLSSFAACIRRRSKASKSRRTPA